MIPAQLDYRRAESLSEVLEALARGDDVKVLAGGQTLIPLLRFRLAEPQAVLDISGLEELRGISDEGDSVQLGALTTYREILDSDLVGHHVPLIAAVTETIGDRQVRNRGTVGGSLAHADPASDLPAAMLALNGSVTLVSDDGSRTVAAREFFQGAFATAMQEKELIKAVAVPKCGPGTGTAYVSFQQKASGYPLVAAAAAVTVSDGTISRADLAFTGLGDRPFIWPGAARLTGSSGSPEEIDAIEIDLPGDIDINEDIHASGPYRKHLAAVAARRALGTAVERAR